MKVSIIVAVTSNGVIGKNNTLPWRLPKDMKFFKEKTSGHVVITGRKNYESIPPAFRPLPNRTNVVVTRQKGYQAEGSIVVDSIKAGLDIAKGQNESECFIIGGADIFNQSLEISDTIYLTRIHTTMEGDTFFLDPKPEVWKETSREKCFADEKNKYDFDFITYKKIESK